MIYPIKEIKTISCTHITFLYINRVIANDLMIIYYTEIAGSLLDKVTRTIEYYNE